MSNWDGCWVISTKNPYDCWLIDNDERKPMIVEGKSLKNYKEREKHERENRERNPEVSGA